jgi:tRNA dimethylallyltransferase
MNVVAIIGPTAVGKTELSLELAERLHAEVISVDSRQVYRYMDVGTDKVSLETRKRIPHHLIDIADPDEVFSAASFVDVAAAAALRIRARGCVPLFVGGTPFYYQALFGGMLSEGLPSSDGVRRKYEQIAEADGPEALHRMLAEVDPVTAVRLHPHDAQRLVRALEIFSVTSTPPSVLYGRKGRQSGMSPLYIGLTRPRAELYERVASRAARQFASGYPEEVAWLVAHGFDERFPSMRGFGYSELAAWCRGGMTLDDALASDIRRTKAFLRRQMTWFGSEKFSPSAWFDLSEGHAKVLDEAADAALKHLRL